LNAVVSTFNIFIFNLAVLAGGYMYAWTVISLASTCAAFIYYHKIVKFVKVVKYR